MSNFHTVRTIKRSRKTHECDECGVIIPVGSTYKRHAGVFDGEFYVFVSCPPCDEIRDLLEEIDPYFWEGSLGGVGEWFAQGMIRETSIDFARALQVERARRDFDRRAASRLFAGRPTL